MANENGQENRETLEAMRHKLDPNWAETCAKCKDGEIEPHNCEYYGEPTGCNSPTYGEHPPVGNAAAMRDALRALRDASRNFYNQILNSKYSGILDKYTCVKQGFPAVLDLRSAFPMANAALSAPPHKGKWENGTMYEYEYAYCSECGRMQWAGLDSHKQADEEIESFARDYKFCPGCGSEMEGGVYVY